MRQYAKPPAARPRRKGPVDRLSFSRRREARVIAAVALTFALLAELTLLSDRSIRVAPERLVAVYRVHGCRCAFIWERAMEQQGYPVAMHELESLKDIRRRLRPTSVRGRHVGEYPGYFVEGHVDPGA